MKTLFLLPLFIGSIAFGQVTDTGDKVGIGTTSPTSKLHVNGTIGIGIMDGSNTEGFRIDYVDGGSGTTTFKNNRWGGDIYFKRNSSLGERTQFSFGGASEHYMNIYNANNEVKVRFNSGSNSYINGGNVGIGTTNPSQKLHISSGLIRLDDVYAIEWGGSNARIYGSNSGNYLRFRTSNIDRMHIASNGDVGIGTTDTQGFKLGVQGKIAAEEVKVATYANWADFVFDNNYQLPTLKEVENHIKENGHLKDIPSAEDVKKDGFFLGEMDSKLLQKIEELTLYLIQQNKQIETLNNRIKTLESK